MMHSDPMRLDLLDQTSCFDDGFALKLQKWNVIWAQKYGPMISA